MFAAVCRYRTRIARQVKAPLLSGEHVSVRRARYAAGEGSEGPPDAAEWSASYRARLSPRSRALSTKTAQDPQLYLVMDMLRGIGAAIIIVGHSAMY